MKDSLSDICYNTDQDSVQNTTKSTYSYSQIIQDQQTTIVKLIQHLTVFVDGNLTLTELRPAIASVKKVILTTPSIQAPPLSRSGLKEFNLISSR